MRKVPGYSVCGKTGTPEKLGEYKEGEKKKYAVSLFGYCSGGKIPVLL